MSIKTVNWLFGNVFIFNDKVGFQCKHSKRKYANNKQPEMKVK